MNPVEDAGTVRRKPRELALGFALTPLAVLLIHSVEVRADPVDPRPEARATSGRADPVRAAAPPGRERLGVELSPFGGTYLGASVGSSWIAGGRIALHLFRRFSLTASYATSYVFAGPDPSYGRNVTDRVIHLVDGSVQMSNDVAIRFGRKVVPADLFLTVGAGSLRLDGRWEALGVLGGGLRLHLGPSWFALRLDLNTYLHRTRHRSGDAVDGDVSIGLGLSFLLPPRRRGQPRAGGAAGGSVAP